MSNIAAPTTVDSLRQMFAVHGLPTWQDGPFPSCLEWIDQWRCADSERGPEVQGGRFPEYEAVMVPIQILLHTPEDDCLYPSWDVNRMQDAGSNHGLTCCTQTYSHQWRASKENRKRDMIVVNERDSWCLKSVSVSGTSVVTKPSNDCLESSSDHPHLLLSWPNALWSTDIRIIYAFTCSEMDSPRGYPLGRETAEEERPPGTLPVGQTLISPIEKDVPLVDFSHASNTGLSQTAHTSGALWATKDAARVTTRSLTSRQSTGGDAWCHGGNAMLYTS